MRADLGTAGQIDNDMNHLRSAVRYLSMANTCTDAQRDLELALVAVTEAAKSHRTMRVEARLIEAMEAGAKPKPSERSRWFDSLTEAWVRLGRISAWKQVEFSRA